VDEKFCVKKRRQLPLPKNVRLLTRAGLEPDDLLQNALISVLATARRALDKKGAFVLQNPENRSPEEILACYAGRTFWRRLWKLASAKE
jgi:hypothetical protein